jgi:hypothetical protein
MQAVRICNLLDARGQVTSELIALSESRERYIDLDRDSLAQSAASATPQDSALANWPVYSVKAFMDDQFVLARPGSFAYFFKVNASTLRRTPGQHEQ